MKISKLTILLSLALLPAYLEAQSPEAIMQREQIRRQEIFLRATKQMEKVGELILEGKTEEGGTLLQEILEEVPQTGEGRAIHEQANKVLSSIFLQNGLQAAANKKWFDAKEAAEKALETNPGNLQAQKLQQRCNQALRISSNGELNPAVDRNLIDELNTTETLFKMAEDYKNTGQLDESAKALQELLAIDPYNKSASRYLKKVNQLRLKISREERLLIRERLLTETVEKWTEDIEVKVETAPVDRSIVPINKSNEFLISEKLRNIVIPELRLNGATIQDAARFLTATTRELDPEGIGVSFLVKNDQVVQESKPVTLNLKGIPVDEALRYITNLAGVKPRIEEFAVFIVPLSERSDVLVNRDFPVRATFFDVEADESEPTAERPRRRRPLTRTADSERADNSYRSALEARGVTFSEGATAIYNQATGILTVRNTQDQIDLIEELVTEDQGESLMVKIETKFIEINQNDLEELTPQFNLEGGYPVGTGGFELAGGQATFSNGLNGAANLRSKDGINRFINLDPAVGSANSPQTITALPNSVGITGALDGNQFASLINLISQKESTDVMTAPSVIVNDGATATVNVGREFSYPTEYDEPELTTSIGDGSTTTDPLGLITTTTRVDRVTVIPSYPSDFDERNIGMNLTVKPQITVDRQRVFLNMKPELVEFDGFINYGSPIRNPVGDPEQEPPIVSNNEIRQPVFSTRTVENAQLEIKDGFTMVLGGLIREDISTVEEKVPFLGDLPLLGRAFRSNAEQSIKRNLLIFVSVRILRPDGEPYNVDVSNSGLAASQ